MPAHPISRVRQTDWGWMLEVFSLALGAGYLVALPAYPYAASPIIKGLSIAALAVLPWISKPVAQRHDAGLLSAALVASSLGDVLLDVGPERFFVPGLCAFLAAHLTYTVLFVSNRSRSLGLCRRLGLSAVFVYAVLFSLWLAPGLGSLKIPVALYICAITAMIASALCSRFDWRVPIGALLFLASDSLLAAGKFKALFTGRGYLVWATYYTAQYLMVTGALCGFRTTSVFTRPD